MPKKTAVPKRQQYSMHRADKVRRPSPSGGVSLTKQSEAAATDINNIIRKYDRTGVITSLNAAQGVFADVSNIGSYQEALETVQEAQRTFQSLPSGLRASFENDPAQFVDWMSSASEDQIDRLFSEVTGDDRYAVPDTPASPPADPPETGD